MAHIGQDITIVAGGLILAKARTASWRSTSEMVDTSAMDDSWDEFDDGSQGWTMSIEQIWVPNDAAYQALRAAKTNGTLVWLKWVNAAGQGERGQAYISELSYDWSRNEPHVVGIEAQGNGQPTQDPDYGS